MALGTAYYPSFRVSFTGNDTDDSTYYAELHVSLAKSLSARHSDQHSEILLLLAGVPFPELVPQVRFV